MALGSVVTVKYAMRSHLADGTITERAEETMEFVFGVERQVPTLEKALKGAKTGDRPQQIGQMAMLEDVKAVKAPDSLLLKPLPDEPQPEKDLREEKLSLMEEDLKYKTGTKETPIIRKKIKPSPLPEEPRGK